jgi:hypothetical protein
MLEDIKDTNLVFADDLTILYASPGHNGEDAAQCAKGDIVG